MDKQMIEEMAKDLTEFFDKTPMELSFNHDNGEVDIIKEKQALKVLDDITRQALIPVFVECLTDLGYRKITEGAVVLTREELEDMKFTQKYCDLYKENQWLKKSLAFIRKGTAEKFAERLRKVFEKDDDWDEYSVGTVRDYVDEICKEISEGTEDVKNE